MSVFIAFQVLLNAMLMLSKRVYFRFSSFVIIMKLIINGNLSIIASYKWFKHINVTEELYSVYLSSVSYEQSY
jgi:hypothetical protein